MPDNIRFSNPDTIAKPPGYSHVVEVTGPGRTVYFAGQLGVDISGKMAGGVREQIELAFENLKAALASVGAGFGHVVKINNYIVDIGANIAPFREIRDKSRFCLPNRDWPQQAFSQNRACKSRRESPRSPRALILPACSALTSLNAMHATSSCAK
jgi:enamine deaminase RidA (YjgF/YER057c/UK114 family)